jgi:hypothetical protein
MVSAIAGVLGTLVGGSTTIASDWISQKTLSRRSLIGEDIRMREKLYAGGASSRATVQAVSQMIATSQSDRMALPDTSRRFRAGSTLC